MASILKSLKCHLMEHHRGVSQQIRKLSSSKMAASIYILPITHMITPDDDGDLQRSFLSDCGISTEIESAIKWRLGGFKIAATLRHPLVNRVLQLFKHV